MEDRVIGLVQAGVVPIESTLRQRLRNVLGGAAGNLVECFDWFTYVTFAIYFSAAIFPGGDQTTQLLKTYLAFGVGFLARPFGAYFMGLYADIAGRRAALVLSVSMMCAGSLAIGLMPTYAQIGILAPILLTLARVAQGLSMGGEYGTSAAYVSEVSPPGQRGFWSGMLYVTIVAGQLAAALLQIVLQAILTDAQLHAWGWRVPFLFGGALALVVFWIQGQLTESASFVEGAKSTQRRRTALLFAKYPKEVAAVVVITAGGGGGFYFYMTYIKDFLVNSSAGPHGHGFSNGEATLISTSLIFFFMVLQPLVGALSDRFGRRLIFAGGFGLGAVVAYPALVGLLAATSPAQAFAYSLPPLIALSGYTALSAIVKAELFPVNVRALGISVPYAVTQAIVGGNIAFLALSLKAAGRETLMFVILAVLLAASCIVATLMRDTGRHSLIEEA